MKTVRVWLEKNPQEDYSTDTPEEFATRLSELFYTKLEDPSVDGLPPASVLGEHIPAVLRIGNTTDSVTRRNIMLDEKIKCWQKYRAAKDKLFLATAHKTSRDATVGKALAKLKETFTAEPRNQNSPDTLYAYFGPEQSMENVIAVALAASGLEQGELTNWLALSTLLML